LKIARHACRNTNKVQSKKPPLFRVRDSPPQVQTAMKWARAVVQRRSSSKVPTSRVCDLDFELSLHSIRSIDPEKTMLHFNFEKWNPPWCAKSSQWNSCSDILRLMLYLNLVISWYFSIFYMFSAFCCFLLSLCVSYPSHCQGQDPGLFAPRIECARPESSNSSNTSPWRLIGTSCLPHIASPEVARRPGHLRSAPHRLRPGTNFTFGTLGENRENHDASTWRQLHCHGIACSFLHRCC